MTYSNKSTESDGYHELFIAAIYDGLYDVLPSTGTWFNADVLLVPMMIPLPQNALWVRHPSFNRSPGTSLYPTGAPVQDISVYVNMHGRQNQERRPVRVL